MNANPRRVERLVMRIQRDFLNTPALRVTLPQAEHRFRLDRHSCHEILGALVDARVLTRTADGAYIRRFPRIVKAA